MDWSQYSSANQQDQRQRDSNNEACSQVPARQMSRFNSSYLQPAPTFYTNLPSRAGSVAPQYVPGYLNFPRALMLISLLSSLTMLDLNDRTTLDTPTDSAQHGAFPQQPPLPSAPSQSSLQQSPQASFSQTSQSSVQGPFPFSFQQLTYPTFQQSSYSSSRQSPQPGFRQPPQFGFQQQSPHLPRSTPLPAESRQANDFAPRSSLQPQLFKGQNQNADQQAKLRLTGDGRQWGAIRKPQIDGQKPTGSKCLTCIANGRNCTGNQLIGDECAECARIFRKCFWIDPENGIFTYQNAQAAFREQVRRENPRQPTHEGTLSRQLKRNIENLTGDYNPKIALSNLGSDRAQEILASTITALNKQYRIGVDPVQNARNLHQQLQLVLQRDRNKGKDEDEWAHTMLMNIMINAIELEVGVSKQFLQSLAVGYT